MRKRVLEKMARDAGLIRDPAQPWLQSWLSLFDNLSVADALVTRYGVSRSEPLWEMLKHKLVNDEVAPLDQMNLLGLLCKVRAGQFVQFLYDADRITTPRMRYWDELEIFRCADGSQTLATKMAEQIRNVSKKAAILLTRAVTHIALSKAGVEVTSGEVDPRSWTLRGGAPEVTHYDYVILAVPPSVWPRVKITADGKEADPGVEIGTMVMAPAVKHFTALTNRFWIKHRAAPSGGSPTIGQVWEGTDNQTQVAGQGIVLSVFAGPIATDTAGKSRAPTAGEIESGLRELYPDYPDHPRTLFSNWPAVPYIETGYVSPKLGEIFTKGKKLNEPYHDRLFFAGEHTSMDFFGYMEGALASGERAAYRVIYQACGLPKRPSPAFPEPPVGVA
jgi:monoamine oxidase